ncbi:hypothetical protein LLG46_04655 [bacterium]|nr:hypothetical protein [bacterium]
MEKLYRIKTTGQMTAFTPFGEVKTEVCVHWFYDQREAPALPYGKAIPAWNDMHASDEPSERNPEYAQRLRAYVDQLFTREEVDTIKDYFLQAKTLETVIEEVDVPVMDYEVPFRAIPPAPEGGDGYGFIELCGIEGYPLPFKVSGFFDVVYDNPYDRYQMSVVKGMIERAGLASRHESDAHAQYKEIGEKLKRLQIVLLDLERALIGLNKEFYSEE